MNDKFLIMLCEGLYLGLFALCFGLWQDNLYAGCFMFGFLMVMSGDKK